MTRNLLLPKQVAVALRSIADRKVTRVMQEFLDSIDLAADQIDFVRLASALERGDRTEALAAVHFSALESTLQRRFEGALQSVFIPAGQLAARLHNFQGAARFDLTNRRSVRWAARHSAKLVQQISAQGKANIRRLIARGFGGIPVRETSVALRPVLLQAARDTLGLTVKQFAAVDRYAAELMERMEAVRLLGAGRSVDDVAAQFHVMPDTLRKWRRVRLDEQVIREKAAAEAARKLRGRAMLIGRTETIDASTAGQNALWRQARDRGLITFDGRIRTYFVTPIGNVRRPPAHPACRCTTALRFVGDLAFIVWVIARDERTCPVCREIPKLNPGGIGLSDSEFEEIPDDARQSRAA